jgi:hypothetical protein
MQVIGSVQIGKKPRSRLLQQSRPHTPYVFSVASFIKLAIYLEYLLVEALRFDRCRHRRAVASAFSPVSTASVALRNFAIHHRLNCRNNRRLDDLVISAFLLSRRRS